jgi:YcxB-like protein
MNINTKKYQMSKKTFIIMGMKNVFKEQWWVVLIALGISALTFIYPDTIWFYIIAGTGLLLYGLFWLIQFTGLTQMDQAKLLFERMSYEINSRQILMKLSTKQGMPIKWDQIKKAKRGKNSFTLVINKAQMIHLPHRVFNSPRDIKLMETILSRKGLI